MKKIKAVYTVLITETREVPDEVKDVSIPDDALKRMERAIKMVFGWPDDVNVSAKVFISDGFE